MKVLLDIRHFQPGEGPSWGLLRNCEPSFEALELLFGSLMFVAVDCEALDCSNFQLGHITIGIIMYCLQADGSFQATFNFKVYKDV